MDEWFIAGNSPVEIARRLQIRYEDGQTEFKAPEGKQWHENVIRRMLKSRYPLGEYRAEVSGEEIFVIGNHPHLRTPEQQEAIDRQFLRRERGTQRANGGPTRYYGIAFCADCKAKMIRLHAIPGTTACGPPVGCALVILHGCISQTAYIMAATEGATLHCLHISRFVGFSRQKRIFSSEQLGGEQSYETQKD
jgi:hypothetical protein